jgi:hypothetical protein
MLTVVLTAGLFANLAGADSFNPVRLEITVAPVARLHAPLPISVRVAADAGALDDRNGPIRAQVKLASECGGTYQYTQGPVLLDKPLSPQPNTGHPYSGAAHGSGRPSAYGVQTVCVWIEDRDQRVFASDSFTQVNVSPACTSAAARYDALRRRHRKRALASAQRSARRACGPGVAL